MPNRLVSLFAAMTLLFGISALRIAEISVSSMRAGVSAGTKSLVLSESRGMIYDRNLVPLVENSYSSVTVGKPTGETLVRLKNVLTEEQYSAITPALSRGRPIAVDCGNVIFNEESLFSVPIASRYSSSVLAAHVVGYLGNGSVSGVSGIEKSFDSFLSENSGRLLARFAVDASGKTLFGKDIEIIDENYLSSAGVKLTIDAVIQRAAEKAAEKIEKGAVVVMDIESGAIRACVSRPNFNPNDIASALKEDNGALFNRAFAPFCVGSVFKPLIAAVALEQGVDPRDEYYCAGSTKLGGVSFGCSGNKSHGNVNMAQALGYSCNGYFANLIQTLDLNDILDKASCVGFGKSNQFADGFFSAAGNLTNVAELDSAAARANFSFGQGSLTATPVQLAALYASIVSDGCSREPYLVEALVFADGTEKALHQESTPYRLFSKKTVDMMNMFLTVAVNEGTGKAAKPTNVKVGGKTATAQSGNFDENGNEILTSWFVGFFPSDKPKYAVAVMCEGGVSGGSDCAPIFRDIAEKIAG